MSAYGDVDLAEIILNKEQITVRGAAERAELEQMNIDLSEEADNYLGRSFTQEGTEEDPVVWIMDAPLGAILSLDDFTQVLEVLAYGDDVTADCLPRKVVHRWAAYQQLEYAPDGVPTGWIGDNTTNRRAVMVSVIAGWPAVPGPIKQAATAALCRQWRARVNMYADGGGNDASGFVSTPAPLLDATYKSKLAPYVRKMSAAIGGP